MRFTPAQRNDLEAGFGERCNQLARMFLIEEVWSAVVDDSHGAHCNTTITLGASSFTS